MEDKNAKSIENKEIVMSPEEQGLTNQINNMLKNIDDDIEKLKYTILKENKNKNIWMEHLKNGQEFINWTKTKYKLQFRGVPKVVLKNQIFYCNLGLNIGSEQCSKRPVVILQNDKGNSSSLTTIVAPITTHEGTIEEIIEKIGENEIKKYIIKHVDGTTKKLDYYEVPIALQPGYKQEIEGYVNLAQIRTVSKKRLDKNSVAMIDDITEKKINKSFKKLLHMYK